MSSTKIPVAKATRSVGRPKKLSLTVIQKTLLTIHTDGVITIEKTEESVTSHLLKKAEQ